MVNYQQEVELLQLLESVRGRHRRVLRALRRALAISVAAAIGLLWGATGPLLLLLIGDPGRGRRIAAVAIFCVLRIGLYALAAAGELLGQGRLNRSSSASHSTQAGAQCTAE